MIASGRTHAVKSSTIKRMSGNWLLGASAPGASLSTTPAGTSTTTAAFPFAGGSKRSLEHLTGAVAKLQGFDAV